MQGAQYPWTLPITFFHSHAIVTVPAVGILFARTEVTSLRLHFSDHAAEKLFQLVQRANLERTIQEVQSLLEDTLQCCANYKEVRTNL